MNSTTLSASLRDAREDNIQELTFHMAEANRLGSTILALNKEIVRTEASQLPANGPTR